MEERGVTPTRTPVEEELVTQVGWQIRLRWAAGVGVLIAAWFATSVLNTQLPQWPLYAVGLFILCYNALFQLYLRQLERGSVSEPAVFDRFAKVQTSLDWMAMILLVYLSGGVESPLLFYYFFHLIIASILLSRRACYFFATLAALTVAALAILEAGGFIPHISFGIFPVSLHQSGLYVASVLFFFTSSLYISVYLATSVTSNLRQKDRELLRLQQRLSAAYQQIEALYEVTRTVSSTLDLEEVLNLIAQSATETMKVKACSIRLLDESRHSVETVAAYGLSEQYLSKGPVDPQQSLHTLRALSGQTTIIPDTSRDDRLQYPAEARAEGITSMMCVPLLLRGKAEGVICIYSAQADCFSDSDAEFFSALASAGATAIENARAYEALAQADRAKSDFVRMVTHEFRSPLSAVQSMLRLLELGVVGPLTEKQQDLVERSQRRISVLLSMVGDLLELAAGRMEMLRGERRTVNLSDIIAKITELMQTRAEEKGIAYTLEMAEEPLVLAGFEDGLERVIMNLVSNAVKYTPEGGSVEVKAWGEVEQIRLAVSDTGIGIPEEAMPRIFTEFYRAKNAKAMEVEGTGLGLVIAKDVIEQHGGQISVESMVGKGTMVNVTLPRS
jgi:K+-sensing histidine kinase KdpD